VPLGRHAIRTRSSRDSCQTTTEHLWITRGRTHITLLTRQALTALDGYSAPVSRGRPNLVQINFQLVTSTPASQKDPHRSRTSKIQEFVHRLDKHAPSKAMLKPCTLCSYKARQEGQALQSAGSPLLLMQQSNLLLLPIKLNLRVPTLNPVFVKCGYLTLSPAVPEALPAPADAAPSCSAFCRATRSFAASIARVPSFLSASHPIQFSCSLNQQSRVPICCKITYHLLHRASIVIFIMLRRSHLCHLRN
jgi:hypothetical protein